MARPAPIILAALRQGARDFSRNDGFALASHVAMSAMLALFPFMLFTVALAGALASPVGTDAMIELVFSGWPDAVSAPVIAEIRAVVASKDGRLITLGGLFAIWFASNGAEAVRVALSRAYRDEDPRPFWQTRALSLAFVLLGGIGVFLGAGLGLALPAVADVLGDAVPQAPRDWLDWISGLAPWMGLLVLVGGVTAAHVWMPGLRHKLRDIWPGVALTFALWGLAAFGFSVYATSIADYGATYAGLAGAMAALIFLYLMAVILIFGAEFNGALMRLLKETS